MAVARVCVRNCEGKTEREIREEAIRTGMQLLEMKLLMNSNLVISYTNRGIFVISQG